MRKYVFPSVVIEIKIFHYCHTHVVHVALVLHLCRSCSTRVTLVLLVSHSCCTRVALMSLVSGTPVVKKTRSIFNGHLHLHSIKQLCICCDRVKKVFSVKENLL